MTDELLTQKQKSLSIACSTSDSTDFRTRKNEWITAMARAGFVLFPLFGTSKVPVEQGWRNIEPNPLWTVDDFPLNYAIAIQKDQLVIDLDPRHFVPGDNPLARLLELCRLERFNTFTVLSGRGDGGIHMFFKKPPEALVKVKVEAFKGVEVKSYGQYVVGPGSIHSKTGDPYTVLCGSPLALSIAPHEILEGWRRIDVPANTRTRVPVDDPASVRFKLFLNATPPAIEGQNGDASTYAVACMGRDCGCTEESTFELMWDWNQKCIPPWTEADLWKKVKNAFSYGRSPLGFRNADYDFQDAPDLPSPIFEADNAQREIDESAARSSRFWQTNKDGTLKSVIPNVVGMFELQDFQSYHNPIRRLIRYNELTQNIEFNYLPPWRKMNGIWSDYDTIALKEFLQTRVDMRLKTSEIWEAVVFYARKFSYHPVRDYLLNLHWDGVDRLSGLLHRYLGSDDTELNRAVSRKILIAAVARVMQPGAKFDHLIVLEGEPGTGKSEFCKILGGEYHAEININTQSKDTILAYDGKWIVEFDDMAGFSTADVNALKALISRTSDRIRRPYERASIDIPRQCIFIGTYNTGVGETYLKDQTGNRKFWPIKTRGLALQELKQDREQLLAEAFHAYNAGETWYLDDKRLNALMTEEQSKRLEANPFTEKLARFLAQDCMEDRYSTVALCEVMSIQLKELTPKHYHTIAHAMSQLGWNKCQWRENGVMTRGFKRPTLGCIDPLAFTL